MVQWYKGTYEGKRFENVLAVGRITREVILWFG